MNASITSNTGRANQLELRDESIRRLEFDNQRIAVYTGKYGLTHVWLNHNEPLQVAVSPNDVQPWEVK